MCRTGVQLASSARPSLVLNGPLTVAGKLGMDTVTVQTQCEAICNVNNTVINAPLYLAGTLNVDGGLNLGTGAAGTVVGGFAMPEGGSLGANSVMN